jgi:hypothetical protein
MKPTLGFAAMLLLVLSGCSTDKHMLEPGHDKRAEVSPEMPSHRQQPPVDRTPYGLTSAYDGPFTYCPDDVMERDTCQDAFDADLDCTRLP